MKTKRLIVAVLATLVLACGLYMLSGGSRLAPKVTVEAVRSLKIGMTTEEIVAAIGGPLQRIPGEQAEESWVYSRPAIASRWYPHLALLLRDDRLVAVGAKRYVLWGLDDEGVYLLGEKRQPAWESPLFTETFPK